MLVTPKRLRQISAFCMAAFPLFITAVAEAASVWDKHPDPNQVLIIAAGFGLVAGFSRLMFWWDPRATWQRMIGSVLASILASVAGALGVYELMASIPTLMMFTAILCGWLGGEAFDLIARRYVLHLLTIAHVKQEEDRKEALRGPSSQQSGKTG